MGKKTYVVYNLEMKKFLQYSKWLIQKLKKGRHTYRVGVGAADSVLGGSGGMLPRESFDHNYASASEAVGDTQHLWQMECNSGDSSYGHFSEPLPL